MITNGATILISAPIVTNLNYLKLNPEQYNQITEDQPLATIVMQQIAENSIMRQCDAPYLTMLSGENVLQKFQQITQESNQVQSLNFSLFKKQKQCKLSTNLQPSNIYVCGEMFKQLIMQQEDPLTVTDMVMQYVESQQPDSKKF